MRQDAEIATIAEHSARFRAVTLEILACVPEDRLEWRPSNQVRTFAAQFAHIAQVEQFYLTGLMRHSWDFAVFQPLEKNSRPELMQMLNGARNEMQRELDALNPHRLDEAVTVPNVPVPWSLRGWLWYVIEHEAHHAAQLSLYLRLVEIIPPFFAFVFPNRFRPDIRH